MADAGGSASALQNSFQFDMDETIGEGYARNTDNPVIKTRTVMGRFENGKLVTLFPLLNP